MTKELAKQEPREVDVRSRLFNESDELDGATAHGRIPTYLSFPTGGSLEFVNSVTHESFREIVGVVLVSRVNKAWYESGYTGGADPPDCSSDDGINGGNAAVCPSGKCIDCEKSGFGGDCKDSRRLVVVTKREEPPIVLKVPVTSVRVWDSYCSALRAKSQRYWSVITKLALTDAMTKGGQAVSKLTTETMQELKDEQVQWAVTERPALASLLKRSTLDSTDDDGGYDEKSADIDSEGDAANVDKINESNEGKKEEELPF